MKLCIEHLSKKYGELQVLRDLSLTLEQDACYCLMSPSGSGKQPFFGSSWGLKRLTAEGFLLRGALGGL